MSHLRLNSGIQLESKVVILQDEMRHSDQGILINLLMIITSELQNITDLITFSCVSFPRESAQQRNI